MQRASRPRGRASPPPSCRRRTAPRSSPARRDLQHRRPGSAPRASPDAPCSHSRQRVLEQRAPASPGPSRRAPTSRRRWKFPRLPRASARPSPRMWRRNPLPARAAWGVSVNVLPMSTSEHGHRTRRSRFHRASDADRGRHKSSLARPGAVAGLPRPGTARRSTPAVRRRQRGASRPRGTRAPESRRSRSECVVSWAHASRSSACSCSHS